MHLAGIADAVLADPALAAALAEAQGAQPTGELTGPEALRPFLAAGLARSASTVLVVTHIHREFSRMAIRGAAAKDIERAPADRIVLRLRDGHRVHGRASLEPRDPLFERDRLGQKRCR